MIKNKVNFILCFLQVICFTLLFNFSVFANDDLSKPNTRVVVNNKVLTSISYNELLPIREVCENLNAVVNWNTSANSVIISYNGKFYQPEFTLIGNTSYCSKDVITNIFGVSIAYDSTYRAISISSNVNSLDLRNILPTYNGYSKEDLDWLSKIIHAEANGEDYASKLAVGSVILNRVADGSYPSTIKGVIFDTKHGVQFTPTANGSIYNNPSSDSYLAALETLEGKRIKENALFFINPTIAKSSWVSRNRDFAFASGNHNFYY